MILTHSDTCHEQTGAGRASTQRCYTVTPHRVHAPSEAKGLRGQRLVSGGSGSPCRAGTQCDGRRGRETALAGCMAAFRESSAVPQPWGLISPVVEHGKRLLLAPNPARCWSGLEGGQPLVRSSVEEKRPASHCLATWDRTLAQVLARARAEVLLCPDMPIVEPSGAVTKPAPGAPASSRRPLPNAQWDTRQGLQSPCPAQASGRVKGEVFDLRGRKWQVDWTPDAAEYGGPRRLAKCPGPAGRS